MFRRVTISILALATMALSLACSTATQAFTDELHGQSPTIVAQKLYDQVDQAYANHDVKQLLDLYDPSFTLIDVKGKRIEYADFRKQQTEDFENARLKNFNRKTTIKDVQLQAGRMVVYYGMEMRFEFQDQKYGWESWINLGSGEATWQGTGDQWKLVKVHVLKASSGIDPQWFAIQRQDIQNKLNAIRRASSVLVPCNYSYNGCR